MNRIVNLAAVMFPLDPTWYIPTKMFKTNYTDHTCRCGKCCKPGNCHGVSVAWHQWQWPGEFCGLSPHRGGEYGGSYAGQPWQRGCPTLNLCYLYFSHNTGYCLISPHPLPLATVKTHSATTSPAGVVSSAGRLSQLPSPSLLLPPPCSSPLFQFLKCFHSPVKTSSLLEAGHLHPLYHLGRPGDCQAGQLVSLRGPPNCGQRI